VTETWVGKDAWGGVAHSQVRKDLPLPGQWRLEAVAATPRPYALETSPDGTRLSFLLDRADLGCDVWVLDLESGATRQVSVDRPPMPFWEDTRPTWSPDGSTLAYAVDGKVAVVPVAGGPSRALAEADSPVWLPDGRLIVTIDQLRQRSGAPHPRSTEVTRLATLDPADPWPVPVSDAGADAIGPVPDPDGRRVAYVTHPPDDRNRSDLTVVDLDSGRTVTVAGTPGMHALGPAWSPSGDRIAFTFEEPGWYEISVAASDGSGLRRLTRDQADFSGLVWSPDGGALLASRARRGRTDLVVVDAASGEVTTLAAGGSWTDARWLPDGSVAALYEDHRNPARIERVDRDGSRRVLFDPAPAAFTAAPHVTPEEIVYRSPDGLEIHGFLFRPADADEGRVPAVVYPHGGPTSAYGDEWDGHAQYFVDKGYAWFAVNFRGSTGYGRDFERSNHGVWGVADTEDCLAAADFLATLDWVDARRIAIFGASYGSYLALCSLVRDPGHRFACGVTKYGDCDILTSWAQGDRGGSEDLERMMGHPADEPEAYRAGSPIHRVDQMARPILVAHGEKDERVHPRQSEELVRALERLGKDYEYVTYPTEGHGLLRTGPQLHFYRRLERFLDWYLM
jgi:dipeptidyl aminopeptidase/acylaminoacyl peptidase